MTHAFYRHWVRWSYSATILILVDQFSRKLTICVFHPTWKRWKGKHSFGEKINSYCPPPPDWGFIGILWLFPAACKICWPNRSKKDHNRWSFSGREKSWISQIVCKKTNYICFPLHLEKAEMEAKYWRKKLVLYTAQRIEVPPEFCDCLHSPATCEICWPNR